MGYYVALLDAGDRRLPPRSGTLLTVRRAALALAAWHHDGVRGLTDPGNLRAVDEPAGKVKVRASGPVHFNLEERERERELWLRLRTR